MTSPIEWTIKAARAGMPEMMYEVGMAYSPAREGETQDLPVNGHKAAYWLQRAAASDNKVAPMAAEDLATLYTDGAGELAPDPAKAYLWLRWATRGGLDLQRLATKLKAVAARLSDDEKKVANAEFSAWETAGHAPAPEGGEPA